MSSNTVCPKSNPPTASAGSPLISDHGLAPVIMTRAVAGLTRLSLPSAHGPASPSPAEHPHPACLLLPIFPAMAARLLFPSDTLNRSRSPCSTTDTDSLPAEQRTPWWDPEASRAWHSFRPSLLLHGPPKRCALCRVHPLLFPPPVVPFSPPPPVSRP